MEGHPAVVAVDPALVSGGVGDVPVENLPHSELRRRHDLIAGKVKSYPSSSSGGSNAIVEPAEELHEDSLESVQVVEDSDCNAEADPYEPGLRSRGISSRVHSLD